MLAVSLAPGPTASSTAIARLSVRGISECVLGCQRTTRLDATTMQPSVGDTPITVSSARWLFSHTSFGRTHEMGKTPVGLFDTGVKSRRCLRFTPGVRGCFMVVVFYQLKLINCRSQVPILANTHPVCRLESPKAPNH